LYGLSGAEIQAVCTEAGYHAIRENRTTVTEKDFTDAVVKIMTKDDSAEMKNMFG
jgi:ATP-dependent 26S proteasome regulatory subunit